MTPLSRPLIYLDTNILIQLFKTGYEDRKIILGLIAAAKSKAFVTSELTLAELLVSPLRNRDVQLTNLYENWTISNQVLEVVPVQRDILRHAAILRAEKRSLKLPDAIHLGTALEAGCDVFLTNEKRLEDEYSIFSPAGHRSVAPLQVLQPGPEVIERLVARVSA